jgi:hypothetical protein
MALPATTIAAIEILKDTLARLESGEIEVAMIHVGIATGAVDPYLVSPVLRTIELRTYAPQKKSDC